MFDLNCLMFDIVRVIFDLSLVMFDWICVVFSLSGIMFNLTCIVLGLIRVMYEMLCRGLEKIHMCSLSHNAHWLHCYLERSFGHYLVNISSRHTLLTINGVVVTGALPVCHVLWELFLNCCSLSCTSCSLRPPLYIVRIVVCYVTTCCVVEWAIFVALLQHMMCSFVVPGCSYWHDC